VMETSLPSPEQFTGATSPDQAELWLKWRRRFERYRAASGLNQKPKSEQVSSLLYCMGDCADDILITLDIDEQKSTYSEVLDALDLHFQVRRNTVVERARFNNRRQSPGEPIEQFIQDVYKLAQHCEFGTLKDELIRDRIVAGVSSDQLSDYLQSKPKLTLCEAVQSCRQHEDRKQNRDLVRGNIGTAAQYSQY